jgi:hypothetical protein
MATTKTQAEVPDKTPPPAVEVQPEELEKQEGPAHAAPIQRAVAPGAMPPTHSAPAAACAAELLTTPEEGPGAPRRARMMEAVQQTVGNSRAGQLMAKPMDDSMDLPIQRQAKGQSPKTPPPITLPLPKEATRKPTGEAEFQSHGVKVVALPDKKRNKPIIVQGKKRDAMTNVRLDWKLPGAKHQAGKVIAVVPVSAPTLTMQTIYGPKAGPETKSGYGKGTTPEDIKAGNTSLGYHEGSHGEYAIKYTKDQPLPVFKGKVGMSVEEYTEAQTEYDQAMEEYRQALDRYHRLMTDCVGQMGDGCEE